MAVFPLEMPDEKTEIDHHLRDWVTEEEARREPPRDPGRPEDALVLASASTGERFFAGTGSRSLTIGAAATCAWRLERPGVADVHVDLVVDDSSIWICARLPAVLDGIRLLGWSPARSGARLGIGDVELVLEHRGMARASIAAAPRAEASRFAMPPPSPENRAGTLRRRRAWGAPLLLLGIAAVAAAAIAASSGPRGAAAADPPRSAPAPEVVVATQPPTARAPASTSDRALLDDAVQALLVHDYRAALIFYRRLAEAEGADGAYAAFVRSLEERIAAQEGDDAP